MSTSNDSSNQTTPPEAEQTTRQPPYRLDSLEQLKAETLKRFQQAKAKIQLYTHNLDPRILNHSAIDKACQEFIRSSRHARLEILITDEKNLQGTDHRLVNLAQRYTSFVSIKVIPRDYHENHFAFYLIDGRQMIYRNLWERFESEVFALPNSKIKEKTKYFAEIWDKSRPASHLRALHI